MRITTLGCLAAIFAALCFAESAIDKMVGTWKFVPERAIPPEQGLAREVIKMEKVGPNTIRDEMDQVTKAGKRVKVTRVQVCDGKESHSQGSPDDVTWICDPTTYNFVVKRAGKLVMDVKTEFSADGRTVTYHRKLLGPGGNWVEDTRVWERQ